MSKSSRRNKKRTTPPPPLPPQTPPLPPQPPPPPRKKSNFWEIFGGILAAISTMITIVYFFKECTTSPLKKSDQENSISGDLKFPKIEPSSSYTNSIDSLTSELISVYSVTPPNFKYDSTNYKLPEVKGILLKNLTKEQRVFIRFGRVKYTLPAESLYGAPDFFKLIRKRTPLVSDGYFIIGLKDDRVYVSTEFKRLSNKETLGIIEFNHWTLFKGNYLQYPRISNDTMLEVRDKENKIAFSIKYGEELGIPGVLISGYFIGDFYVTVINSIVKKTPDERFFYSTDRAPGTTWEDSASAAISRIRSLR